MKRSTIYDLVFHELSFLAPCGLSKVDVTIILDASTSVTEANFQKMRQFAKDLVDKADVDSGSVRFATLIYSTDVQVQFYLDQFSTRSATKAAIDKIPYIYGSTNSADALKTMHTQVFNRARGDRPAADNIAFMITDGVSNINSRRTIPEADNARRKGIEIYAIGKLLLSKRFPIYFAAVGHVSILIQSAIFMYEGQRKFKTPYEKPGILHLATSCESSETILVRAFGTTPLCVHFRP